MSIGPHPRPRIDIGIRAKNPAATKPRAPGIESREPYLPNPGDPSWSWRVFAARTKL